MAFLFRWDMKQEKKHGNNRKVNRRQLIILAVVVCIMVVLTISSLFYVEKQSNGAWETGTASYEQYDRHYIFITNSSEDNFWSKVYQKAKKYGAEENVYIEWGGSDLTVDYSKEELLKIAIASKVDGIVVEGDGGVQVQELINEAVGEGIPVVTVMTDSYDSKRQSFIGIGSHNLGREYGRQIIRNANKETKEVLVLMDASAEDSGKNIVYNGIQDTLSNEGNHLNLELNTLAISEDSPYSVEEAIRGIFLNREELPEIIVCLNEKNTISVYQALIDYNYVGQVNILGYSDADTILNAISRNVIAATVVVDAQQMGIYCVKSLDEYLETGHVNDFITMDVNVVTQRNIEEYLKNAEKQKEE
ncbi:MAG: sugar ABC transporter substrate-binding protein [Lachnospiraceae bacterium]|nr:sugar ABC transporter substrate-binding protein [Lachnospiraceae bacterium]